MGSTPARTRSRMNLSRRKHIILSSNSASDLVTKLIILVSILQSSQTQYTNDNINNDDTQNLKLKYTRSNLNERNEGQNVCVILI